MLLRIDYISTCVIHFKCTLLFEDIISWYVGGRFFYGPLCTMQGICGQTNRPIVWQRNTYKRVPGTGLAAGFQTSEATASLYKWHLLFIFLLASKIFTSSHLRLPVLLIAARDVICKQSSDGLHHQVSKHKRPQQKALQKTFGQSVTQCVKGSRHLIKTKKSSCRQDSARCISRRCVGIHVAFNSASFDPLVSTSRSLP